jgi:hypothetical protein
MEGLFYIVVGILVYLQYKSTKPAPTARVTLDDGYSFEFESVILPGRFKMISDLVDREIQSIVLSNGHSLPQDTPPEGIQAIIDQTRVFSIMESGPFWRFVCRSELEERLKRIENYHRMNKK